MTKEDVEKWCEENHHIIIDINKKDVPIDTVLKIASVAVGVDNIAKKTQEHKYSFGRYMAMEYLFDKLPTEVIAPAVGLERTMVYHAKKKNIFTTDLKFFKGWERNAIT